MLLSGLIIFLYFYDLEEDMQNVFQITKIPQVLL